MEGYTTNYVNLIADNLRERYDNGFPILKELIQNADDAKARTFLFARHAGFTDAVHPLLKGPGLWFFNDGEFKDSDGRALRSFGINSKAGDATAIGKFGLGMKSVFHLCEALFYLAWDGARIHREGLSPWKQEGANPHPEWEEIPNQDWRNLEDLARPLAPAGAASWFLLWIPLRRLEHLGRPNGQETGAIINRFPGDDTQQLAFLEAVGLDSELAQILPLLRHLERIEHCGDTQRFTLQLQAEQRLLAAGKGICNAGEIHANGRRLLRYAGLRGADGRDRSVFADLKAREEWPRSWYRDENGHERQAQDKTAPEGAVLFCAGQAPATRSLLHWAVFLPLEQGGERLGVKDAEIAHTLILHGQFFIDAGRKKIHGLETLHQEPPAIDPTALDDALLRHAWNRHLAQKVLLPLVIPALEHYVAEARLREDDCTVLTQALADSQWFARFRSYACNTDDWVRVLAPDAKPAWACVTDERRGRLRPLPSPPKAAPERPWQVFPRLAEMWLLPFDGDAPSLTRHPHQWTEEELLKVLAEVSGLFSDGPSMEYLEAFLKHPLAAAPYQTTGALQTRLIGLFRQGLRSAGPEGRRRHAERSRRLLEFIEPQRRLPLAAELPDATLRRLWAIEARVLLVPKGVDGTPGGQAAPDDGTLADWLAILDQGLAPAGHDNDRKPLLDAIQGLLKTLDPGRRGAFLRVHDRLRVIATRDARTGSQQALSFAEVQTLRDAGTLFGFAQGTQDAQRLGLTPFLAAALPEASIALVQAPLYRELFEAGHLPSADRGLACLIAVGKDGSGRLGSRAQRLALLERADDSESDAEARRGLRYLLHGSAAHRNNDDATLWIRGHDQHPAWAKLWGQIHGADAWGLVPNELADTLPRGRWKQAGVQEIDARNLIAELRRTGQGIPNPGQFIPEEREEILSQIDDENLWWRLSLHTRTDDTPVTAVGDLVYLAPEWGAPDDPLLVKATLIKRAREPRVIEQQLRWLRPLDDRARIELALAAAVPATHWHTLLGDLGQLADTIDADLRARLRGTAWLPTRDGGTVKPEDVIDLPPGLADEAQRLVGEHRVAQGPCYATPADLIPDLLQHPVWVAQGRALCASGTAGLGQLGLLLSDLPDYRIGPWTQAPDAKTIELLARCDALPGWRLLAQARVDVRSFDGDTAWSALRDGLAKDPRPGPLRAAMDWLSQDTTGWNTRKAAFDQYLNWYKDGAQLKRVDLADLRLTSLNREWRVAAQLCAGAHGIDGKHVLDPAQVEILGGAIRRADTGQVEADGMPTSVTRADFDTALVPHSA
ncbi:MAG: hypothetical protein KA204_03705 [Chromatiaceae bacterium]|nr:hypothetical protein [Chromatiaceae bacterium]MBP6734281.1 hypothetical protein [Chromatiaceae bacterium]MBP6807741.1 hypothetical protein [Chromatiaceae bacterium]MBP8283152.1 hypothetical protein [Chromatiaceae bacterium]MBP8289592.1 hypothetical protein [Chromatiaceae bacterium]